MAKEFVGESLKPCPFCGGEATIVRANLKMTSRQEQEQIVKEWANLFNYEVNGFEYEPEISLHDFEAMVIYKFMSEAFKEKGFERKIATALYMAKHGLTKSNELPWK